jgi:plastocyanin domain-containing protein
MNRRTLAVLAMATLLSAPVGYSQAPSKTAPKVQDAKLTLDAKGYVVTPSTLTKGVPVRMEVDLSTVKGCMRTVVIDAFGVKKTVAAGDTTVEFTPTKAGDIEIVCGMNMGRGKFKVVEPAAR